MPTSDSLGWRSFSLSHLKWIQQQRAENAHPTDRLLGWAIYHRGEIDG